MIMHLFYYLKYLEQLPILSKCVVNVYKVKGHNFFKNVITAPNPKHTNVIRKGDMKPGENVSTNQYECRRI